MTSYRKNEQNGNQRNTTKSCLFAQIRMGRSLRSSDMKIFSIERERIGMEGRERDILSSSLASLIRSSSVLSMMNTIP